MLRRFRKTIDEATTRWQTNVRSTEYGPDDCMTCDGSGEIPGEGTCWTCAGSGKRQSDDACPSCGGTGEIVRGTSRGQVCPDCNCCSGESVSEGFDKFMDAILISESRRQPSGDSPLRERARRHQERPLGRIKFGGVK